MKRWIATLFVGLAVAQLGLAQENMMSIDVTTDKHGFQSGPICIPLTVQVPWAKLDEVAVEIVTGKDPGKTVGQLTPPSLITDAIKSPRDNLARRDLHLILPSMEPNKTWTLKVHFQKTKPTVTRFAWTEKQGHTELILTRSGTFTPFLRYMNRPYDASSKEARDKSYKVFHHLYDPAGKRLVTNGGHADDKIPAGTKLLYPHHRGIMYGFNKCAYGEGLKKKADTWHCTGDTHVAHLRNADDAAGPVLGRHRVVLGWFGAKNEQFAQEERELTVYKLQGGTLVEFASRLTPTRGKIRLDGDPQHAGFQFRAHNDVAAKTAKQTYYLHPDGKGALGATRNWPGDETMVDLPWYVMSFMFDSQRYSACYLNHPNNPKQTRFSERDYGRFGGYFEREVAEDRPLLVNYRLWLQNGEMTAEQASGLRAAFATPPTAEVK